LEILFSRGFSNAIIRFYHEETEENRGVVVTTSICLIWALGLLVIPLPLIFSAQISLFVLGNAVYADIIRLALITLLFEVSANCASNYLLIKQKSVLYSAVGFARLVVGISLNILFVLILKCGVIGVFIASLITAVVTSIIFHWPVIREFGLKFDATIARNIIRFQLPLVPGDLLSFFSRQTERVMVRFLISLHGVGILEMAYKFPPLLNLIITQPFLCAWRTKSIEIGDRENADEIIGKMFTKYFFMMVFAGLIMAVNIDNILFIMTPSQFWDASSIVKIEIITTIVVGSISSLEFGLLYKKQTRVLSKIISASSILKIIISYALIKSYGIKGAAYSACLLAIIQAILVTIYSQRSYRVELEYMKIAVISIAAFGMALLINNIQYASFLPAVFIKTSLLPAITELLGTTAIGEWKSGKLIYLFKMKEDQIISLLFNTLLSLLFLSIIPLLWREKFTARWQENK
jgi:O-antigen/teichoic acid export membrane protein